MAYMIKHNYEPSEGLLKNKIKQRELVEKALIEIKNTCFIVKNTGEIGDFHYIEFKKEVDEKLILRLINMVCCKEVGNAIYLKEGNKFLKLKIPLIVSEEEIDFILSNIKKGIWELQGEINNKRETAIGF